MENSARAFGTTALLWIGDPKKTAAAIAKTICKYICPAGGCGHCRSCTQVGKKEHPQLLWLTPKQGQYLLEDVKTILDKSAFALEIGESFIIVIEQAELLTHPSANMLLKVVEEPPEGYKFLFSAENEAGLLPTLQSRCVVQERILHTNRNNLSQMGHLFSREYPPKYEELTRAIKSDSVSSTREQIKRDLEELLQHWLSKSKQANPKISYTAIEWEAVKTIRSAMKKLPMPGSSKLFWQNLFSQFHVHVWSESNRI